MTVYRLVEIHCDGDNGDCPNEPDATRSQTSARALWDSAQRHGWVRRVRNGRAVHLCPQCQRDEQDGVSL